MSSLQVQLSEKAKLMEEVASQFGEVTDEQVAIMNELSLEIPAKVDAWCSFIKENIPDQIKEFKTKIQEYKDAIDKLELFKEKKELYLHNLLKSNGLEEINGEERRIVKTLSIKRELNKEVFPVDDPMVRHQINVTFDELVKIRETLPHSIFADDRELKTIYPNVTDLPEDHPAIVKSIRQTVKILKAKK